MSTKHRADEIAAILRDAGFAVERKDYPMAPGESDIGERHYVLVTDGLSRCEVQTNGLRPAGSVGSYGGPYGDVLYGRVRDLLAPHGVL